MASVNKIVLLGFLGKTPELKVLESGKSVCSFSVATSETYKDKAGTKVTDTEWHNCTAWNKTADIISKYFTKGSKIYLEGKIKTEFWEKNGEKRESKKVIVSNFDFIDSQETKNQLTEQNDSDFVDPDKHRNSDELSAMNGDPEDQEDYLPF